VLGEKAADEAGSARAVYSDTKKFVLLICAGRYRVLLLEDGSSVDERRARSAAAADVAYSRRDLLVDIKLCQ